MNPSFQPSAEGATRAIRPVTIVVPAFGAASQLRDCLEGLARHLSRRYEVVVADDATPDDSVAEVTRSFEAALSLAYVRRPQNVGFVENCNEAMRSILPSGNDVLLLNSDTQVTAGFLEEMSEVLHLHEKHGVVSPRSNNATIFSVPASERLPPAESFELWKSIRCLLPRYQVMPTAVGFCMLIKHIVLRQLGVFDPAYSPGYNEENDWVCRINRCGYSAVAANHAFVFHHESSSFGPRRKALEQRNSQILSTRYPEYWPKVAKFQTYGVDPIDHFSTLWRPHRKHILFDFFHLPAKHSGTSEFALNLLLNLAPLLESRYELSVGLSEEAKQFFSSELTGYRFYDSTRQAELRFDLVYKPVQLFTWSEWKRMVRLGGRIAFTHLDIIAVRCDYLSNAGPRAIFKTAAQFADRVFTISEFSQSDFAAYYNVEVPFEVIHLGTHEQFEIADRSGGYVLVIGNEYHHKAVDRAVAELKGVADLVVLGADRTASPRIRWLPSGTISRSDLSALYDRASVVVYPSLYEGFGMPIVDALAKGIPVVAIDSVVNQEVRSVVGDRNLFLVPDHQEMRSIVARIVNEPLTGPGERTAARTWREVAGEYARSFDDLLARQLDVDLLRRRWDLLMTIDAVHPLP